MRRRRSPSSPQNESPNGPAHRSDDSNHVRRLDVILLHHPEHRGSATHERRRIRRVHSVGDVEEVPSAPDAMRRHRPDVRIHEAVILRLVTIYLVPTEAVFAVAARAVQIAEASAVASLEILDVRSDFLDDPNAFVTEDHVSVVVVKIGPADTAVGQLQEDFIPLEGTAVTFRFDNGAGGAFEDCECVS